MHAIFSGKTEQVVIEESSGIDTGQYKKIVADVIIQSLQPIREKTNALLSDRTNLLQILKSNTDRAKEIAYKNLNEVKKKIGLLVQ